MNKRINNPKEKRLILKIAPSVWGNVSCDMWKLSIVGEFGANMLLFCEREILNALLQFNGNEEVIANYVKN